MSILARGMILIATSIAGTAVVAGPASPPGAQYYRETDPAAMQLPFSEAVRAGSMLYLSGAIGTDESGKLVAGGMEAEAQQTMDNIGAVLKRHGSGFDQVVQCTVALADIKDWPAFNDIYRRYFTLHFPARMAFAAPGLALGARVEVQCNATLATN